MRLFLIGQKAFAVQVLAHLGRRHEIAGVCAPEADRLRTAADARGVPVWAPAELVARPLPSDLDLIVCAHAHVFVPATVRAQARYGALGYHPSLLPRWRGKEAVEATLASGDRVAGGTVYWLDDGLDTGPVAAQDRCPVLFDNPRDLWRRQLAPMGLYLLDGALARLEMGCPLRRPQDERRVTDARAFMRGQRDARLRPHAPAGLVPYDLDG